MKTPPLGNLELIHRVLGDELLSLSITKLTLEEDVDAGLSRVVVDVVDAGGRTQSVAGQGCGLVDALWEGFASRYSMEYQSLRSIELVAFDVQAKLDTKSADNLGSDAVCEVSLKIRNSEGVTVGFKDASRSIAMSSSRAVVASFAYFINAERAFIRLYHSLQDARERQRADLITRYTQELAEVVKSTSYAEVIENLKKTL